MEKFTALLYLSKLACYPAQIPLDYCPKAKAKEKFWGGTDAFTSSGFKNREFGGFFFY